ncbi:ABC transporter substrate-binding protein [Rhodovastum atsumiense]|uniref:ABC transporter substrate-binding protein n=1 Tax=Rhodovastum atsumiense TaxID=504468 RepID=A0A5M6IR29_9PROT|nr:ABC transporter substrate-binding protein [Rhodovastum atsumiense]KAA5609978.1 ABC transporter substrate-binding protein [Rhodovastum atsumiense]CAH2598618.1 ABC transporter substrate-binding protein [Rhodovastum atsumiense]
MSKNWAIAAAAALIGATACVPSLAQAQQKTLYVAAYGGSFETIMRQKVFPDFERSRNVRIAYVAGNSTDTLAKLQAQKNAPDIDVIIVDDGPMQRALQLGFCAPLKPGPSYANLYDVAKISPEAVATGAVGVGIAYNADAFQKLGWAVPQGWTDLADPKFKGKIATPGIDNTYGLQELIMFARINGGDIDHIDPGFAYMKSKIAPNMRAFESSPGRMSELFQSGEIVAAVWGSSRTKALAMTGFPAKFVFPKEGSPALFTTACVVKGARNEADGQAFIETLLAPPAQVAFAETGAGPVNKKVELTPEQAQGMPYGPAEIAKLVTFDWPAINTKRDAWTKRWNREIER